MKITKSFTFDAGHRLSNYEGKCKNLHGHTYKVEITIKGTLDKIGMLIDFGTLKEVYNKTVDAKFDHKLILFQDDPLNKKIQEVSPEAVVMVPYNPTAENFAKDIFNMVADGLDDLKAPGLVDKIRVYETPTSYAEFNGEIL